jgi:hypothetical protein
MPLVTVPLAYELVIVFVATGVPEVSTVVTPTSPPAQLPQRGGLLGATGSVAVTSPVANESEMTVGLFRAEDIWPARPPT